MGTIFNVIKDIFTGDVLKKAIEKTSPGSKLIATPVAISPISAIPSTISSFGKSVLTGVGNVVKKLGIVKTTGLVAGGIVATNVLASSPTARKEVLSGIQKAPSSLANFGKNIGTFIEDPSVEVGKNILTENPVISSAVAGGIAIITAKSVGGLVSSASSFANTQAVQEQTKVTQAQTEAYSSSSIPQSVATSPSTPQGAIIPAPVLADENDLLSPPALGSDNMIIPSEEEKPKKKRKAKKKQLPIRQTVNIYQDNDVFDLKGKKNNLKRMEYKNWNG